MKRLICLALLAAGIIGFSGCSRTENLENSVVRLAKAIDGQNELLGVDAASQPENKEVEGKLEEFDAVILMEGMEEPVHYIQYNGKNFDLYYDAKTFAYGDIEVSKDSLCHLLNKDGVTPEEMVSFYPFVENPEAGVVAQLNVLCYQHKSTGTADRLMKLLWERTWVDYQTDFVVIEQTNAETPADSVAVNGSDAAMPAGDADSGVVTRFRGVREIEGQMHYIWVNETQQYTYVMEYLVPSEMYEGFGARFQDMIQYLQYQQ